MARSRAYVTKRRHAPLVVEGGALRAIDPLTGDRKWEFRYPTTSSSGILSTASGLVFSGDGDGNIIGLDSRSGKYLWHYNLGVGLRSTGGTTRSRASRSRT